MKKTAALVTAVAAASLFAANARMDAMGGTYLQRDASDAVYNPALMGKYANTVQATGSASGDYDFFAYKSITDGFFLGLTLDGAGVDGQFYTDAQAAAGVAVSPVAIPNLLIGLDFGSLSLGAEVIYDIYREKSYDEDEAADSKVTDKAKLGTKGVKISAAIDGGLALEPYVGVQLLTAQATTKTEGATNSETEDGTDMGLALEAGALATIDMGDKEFGVGIDWKLEKYRFMSNDGSTTTVDDDTEKDMFFNYLLGFTGTKGDALRWVTEYKGSISSHTTTSEPDGADNDTKASSGEWYHNLALSFERPVDGFWIFDGLTPRAGFDWGISRTMSSNEALEGQTNLDNANNNNAEGFNLNAGFGLTKGRATIDLATNFGEWNGAISGPTGASASLTVDFGKGAKSAPKKATKSDDAGWDVQ